MSEIFRSPSRGGSNTLMKMTIEPEGYYFETLAVLLPALCLNTQQCEYETSTNHMWWQCPGALFWQPEIFQAFLL
jgi:hypothetical protein